MSDYVNSVCEALGSVIYEYLISKDITNVSSDTLTDLCLGWYDEQAREEVALSAVRPDIRQIIEQLQTYLSTHNSWKDTITASTGQFIIDLIAGVGALNQLSIERAVHETMLKTAVMESSIIANTRNLGVHVRRKSPSQVICTLSNNDGAIEIPPYSQFTIGSNSFFNRSLLIFGANETKTEVYLYQGSLHSESFYSTGEAFQRIEIGTSNFTVSDTDILVDVDGVDYARTIDGLYHYSSTDTVFDENTLPSGNVELRFGNGSFGVSPKIGSLITIRYIETLGNEANSAEVGLSVSFADSGNISGVTTGTISEGSDEWETSVYKVLAPQMWSAQSRMTNRESHVAIGMNFPGMIDIQFRGQAETFPNDKNYMNVVTVTPLPTNTAQAWQGLQIVLVGEYRTNAGKIYKAGTGGACGETAPTHTVGTVSDGGVDWQFYSYGSNAPWTSLQFETFKSFLTGVEPYSKGYAVFGFQFIYAPPTPVTFTVNADVYCTADSSLINMKEYLTNQLVSKTRLKYKSLGKSIAKSDIYDWLLLTHKSYGSVDYIVLNSPSESVSVGPTQYAVLDIDVVLNMHHTNR